MAWARTKEVLMAMKTFNDLYALYSDIPGSIGQKWGKAYELLSNLNFDWESFYNLMKARHGTDVIVGDVDHWELRFFSIMYEYGPYWARQMSIQKSLLTMSDNELREGSLSIYNTALNPADTPSGKFSGGDIPKIETLNSQNTTTYQKTKKDAYVELSVILNTNYTEDFLRRFDKLFKKILDITCYEGEDEES